ncbi:hypothetical protein LCI18_002971 [Fusarium solani-melongenae]|uniref:Uncharacterized protein n=1 Tax=Fusarium solani subsp. cucurbitae TaxID=2747967 RepID=A0ACD3YSV8_FUSSC|nr:hypothetical protein LCI18_002971 [Fusarium solani-melongenae]
MIKSSIMSTWSNMGRRAFTNPSKIESERERARNQYLRQECSTCPIVRMVNSIYGQLPT